MISVGIDVSKGKSTVCILKPYGEIVASPFEVRHTESELKNLIQMIQRLDGEIRIVLSGRLNDASSSTLFGADSQMVA